MRINIDEDISSTILRHKIDIAKLPQKCAVEIEKFYKEINAN